MVADLEARPCLYLRHNLVDQAARHRRDLATVRADDVLVMVIAALVVRSPVAEVEALQLPVLAEPHQRTENRRRIRLDAARLDPGVGGFESPGVLR